MLLYQDMSLGFSGESNAALQLPETSLTAEAHLAIALAHLATARALGQLDASVDLQPLDGAVVALAQRIGQTTITPVIPELIEEQSADVAQPQEAIVIDELDDALADQDTAGSQVPAEDSESEPTEESPYRYHQLLSPLVGEENLRGLSDTELASILGAALNMYESMSIRRLSTEAKALRSQQLARYAVGQSLKEIAETFNVTESSLKSAMPKVIESIGTRLDDEQRAALLQAAAEHKPIILESEATVAPDTSPEHVSEEEEEEEDGLEEPTVEISILDSSLVIDGYSYDIEPSEAELLEIIKQRPSPVTGKDIAVLLHGPETTDTQAELIEDLLFGLFKRCLLTESVREVGKDLVEEYAINLKAAEDLSHKELIYIDDNVVYLGDQDIAILRTLLDAGVPLVTDDIARMLSPDERLDTETFHMMVRTVKKYFHPLRIVGKDRGRTGRRPGYFLHEPDVIRHILSKLPR